MQLMETSEAERIATEAETMQQTKLGPNPIHVQTESTVPKLNSVLQVTKGPHRGRLCQVGRIDLDKFRCFVVLVDNGRDFFDVRPDEYILIAQPKKGMTGLKDPLDIDPQPSTTATPQPAEESPFRNL